MQNNFKPLKEIINIQHGYAFESSFFSTKKTDFILLTPGNFGKDQKLHFGEKTKFYNANPPEDYILNNGDLLVVMTDLTPSMEILGNCVQLESDTKILHNQRIGKIEFLSEKVDSLYLLYTLNSNNFRKFIKNTASGTTVRHTSPSRILENTILLPPLPEQKKIAAILSTWDRAIEGTEKLLANSQQQKKALMQQLLTGKKRLPGFTGEWKICSLSDVATVQTATSKTQYICDNGERFIVDMGSVNRLGNLVCTKSTQHNADLLPKGTLVMPKDDIGGGNIIGRTSYIDRDDLYVLGDHVYALHIGDCDSKFLHFLINSHPINKNLRRRANGTAQLGLGKKDVLRQKIKIPSEFSEQKAIAAVLTTADEEITALESDLSRLRQEKKALMQQLLTGKRRVTVD